MLSSLIEKQLLQLENVGEVFKAKNGKKALKIFKTNYIDFVLLDLTLPDTDGMSLIPKFKDININLKIIVISAESKVSRVKEVARMGIDGYVSKSNNDSEIVRAIHSVNNGKRFISDDILELLINEKPIFEENLLPNNNIITVREKEILGYIASQMTSKQIAEHLSLSKHTVNTHKRRMMKKLKVNNVAGLIKVAYEKELISK